MILDATLHKLAELVQKADSLEVYYETFITQNWLDNYNGKEPQEETFPCINVDTETLRKIEELVEKLLNIIGKNEEVKIDKIALCKIGNQTDIVIQLKEDVHNEYGRWVGTDYWWTTLSRLLESAEEKLRNLEQTERELKEKLEKLRSVLS